MDVLLDVAGNESDSLQGIVNLKPGNSNAAS